MLWEKRIQLRKLFCAPVNKCCSPVRVVFVCCQLSLKKKKLFITVVFEIKCQAHTHGITSLPHVYFTLCPLLCSKTIHLWVLLDSSRTALQIDTSLRVHRLRGQTWAKTSLG